MSASKTQDRAKNAVDVLPAKGTAGAKLLKHLAVCNRKVSKGSADIAEKTQSLNKAKGSTGADVRERIALGLEIAVNVSYVRKTKDLDAHLDLEKLGPQFWARWNEDREAVGQAFCKQLDLRVPADGADEAEVTTYNDAKQRGMKFMGEFSTVAQEALTIVACSASAPSPKAGLATSLAFLRGAKGKTLTAKDWSKKKKELNEMYWVALEARSEKLRERRVTLAAKTKAKNSAQEGVDNVRDNLIDKLQTEAPRKPRTPRNKVSK